ncbi:MAG: glycoside hydrolase family 88 protein [Bacteroidales bacterium]|nr:glycoside hydrolase family 88 protein [Bacteroidales bacterium]
MKQNLSILSYLLLTVFLLVSCHSVNSTEEIGSDHDLWSVKIANSVIRNHENLVNYNRPPGNEKWQYDVAMLAMAIDKLGSYDEKYSGYQKGFIDFFIDSIGNVYKYDIEEYNLDRINPGKNVITLYKRTGDEKYYKAIQLFVKQLETHPKTKSGGFWHKKIYPCQMWLDGSYMATPFIAQYAKEFNQPRWFDVATFQLIQMQKNTLDKETGLLYHAWDESKTQKWCNPATGQSKEFWGRAIGWYTMALVDVLDYLPKNHEERDTIISILNSTSEALLKVRDKETGLWYQVLDKGNKDGNYLEASCSAMYTYVFAKGAKYGYLPEKYRDIANGAFQSMINQFISIDTEGNINLTNTCGGCGLGGNPYRDGSYEYYITEKQVMNDPKGVAPFILAAIELNK